MRARPDRWWNFSSVLYLFLALILTSLKVQSTDWVENLYLLNWLTFSGYLLGITIGYSRFKSVFVTIFITVFSVFFLPWTIGLTYDSTIDWTTRLTNLLGRITLSIQQIGSEIQLEDPLLFFILLATVIWFSSLFGGYLLVRKSRPWIPLFISAILIFATEIYDQSTTNLYTGIFIFFVLLLISKVSFLEIGRNWRSKGIPVELETENLFRKTSIIIAVIIVLLSWNVTNIVSAFQKDSTQQKQILSIVAEVQSQFSKITAPLQGTSYIRSEFFGDTVELGTGSDLTDEVIFEISVNQSQPPGVRYYWKGKSYDTFTNNRWESTINSSREFVSNEEMNPYLELETYTKRTFTIKTYKNLGILYSPLYPQTINRPVKTFYQILPNDQIDIVSLALEKITFSGEVYEVVNSIPNPTIAQLRKTTQDYPDWVLEKYLQLPSNFSEKITDLAFKLTETQTNPYDKVNEITNYLRKNITYNTQIPAPPPDQDVMEWFLFEHKEGFCNYYATAEVLMLRSIGIPARISFGYAEGEAKNIARMEFIVRRDQLHAWPEVYFQGIGWVPFEPTTIQPDIDRLAGESFGNNTVPSIRDVTRQDLPVIDGGESLPDNPDIPEIIIQPAVEEEEVVPENGTLSIILLVVGIFGLVLYLIFKTPKKNVIPTPIILETFFDNRGWKVPKWLKLWASYSKLSDVTRAFSKIIWSLYLFKKPVQISLTPSEIVHEYNSIFPEMKDISTITLLEYQKAIYSNQEVDLKLIQENSNKLFLYSLKLKFTNMFKKKYKYQNP